MTETSKPLNKDEAQKLKAELDDSIALLLGNVDIDIEKKVKLAQPILVQTVECKELIVRQLTLAQKVNLSKTGVKLDPEKDGVTDSYLSWPDTKPDKFLDLMASCTYSADNPDVQLSKAELGTLCSYDAAKLATAFFSLTIQ